MGLQIYSPSIYSLCCIKLNELISKHLREKTCLSMAPSTPVTLIRIQTPSFSICHGPNIDLYVTRTWNQWKQHGKPNEWDFYSLFKFFLISLLFCFTLLSTTAILSAVRIKCESSKNWALQDWMRNNILQIRDTWNISERLLSLSILYSGNDGKQIYIYINKEKEHITRKRTNDGQRRSLSQKDS